MDYDSKPYWDNCSQKVLSATRCADCGNLFHPNRATCPACLSENVALLPVSGRGTLYTYTIARATAGQPARPIVWVALEEQDDVIIPTSLAGDELPAIGGAMVVDWMADPTYTFVPVWRAAVTA